MNRILAVESEHGLEWTLDGHPSILFMEYHEIGITILWGLLSSLMIFYSMYQYKKYAFYIHAIIGIIIILYTLSMTLPILIVYSMKYGFGDYNIILKIGAWFGLFVALSLIIVLFTGVFSRIMQERQKSSSSTVIKSKKIHKILGYSIVFIAKLNVILGWYPYNIWWFNLAFELLILVMLVIRKTKFPLLQAQVINQNIKLDQVPSITDLNTISKQIPYVIFSDYIYNVQPLKKYHPAGYEIIRVVQGREIDKFIYGMYSAQLLPQVPIFSHSYKSLNLVGQPIGKLSIPSPYVEALPQLFDVIVKFRQIVSHKGQIHLIGLQPFGNKISITYKGYSDIKQLGQYYSLNINNKTTRLYTSVNFLTESNVTFMNQIFKQQSQSIREYYQNRQSRRTVYQYQPVNLKLENSERHISQIQTQYIPLMMKKYSNGVLTSELLRDDFNGTLKLSCNKGLGLHFSNLIPGKVIIIAGGTGLYPFMDLIDLLFKQKLVLEKHQLKQTILLQNPILNNKPFDGFSFLLFGAFNQPEDIHPITLQQLSYLCKAGQSFKTVLRVKQRSQEIQKEHKSFSFTKNRFDKILIETLSSQKFTKIWICGPPILNTETSKTLLANGFTSKDFMFI